MLITQWTKVKDESYLVALKSKSSKNSSTHTLSLFLMAMEDQMIVRVPSKGFK